MKYKCKKCDHEWLSHLVNPKPKECPNCKFRAWDKEKKNGNAKSE